MIKQRISVNWYWSTVIGQSHYVPERMRAIRGPRDITAQAPIRRLAIRATRHITDGRHHDGKPERDVGALTEELAGLTFGVLGEEPEAPGFARPSLGPDWAGLLPAGVRIVGLGLGGLLCGFLGGLLGAGRRRSGRWRRGGRRFGARGLVAAAACAVAPRHLERLALGEGLGIDDGELAQARAAEQHEEVLGPGDCVGADEVRVVLRDEVLALRRGRGAGVVPQRLGLVLLARARRDLANQLGALAAVDLVDGERGEALLGDADAALVEQDERAVACRQRDLLLAAEHLDRAERRAVGPEHPDRR